MASRFHLVIVVLLTVALLVIFISPAVPSAPRTTRARLAAAPLYVTFFAPVLPMMPAIAWRPVREALVMAHAPDVVDLTSARLC